MKYNDYLTLTDNDYAIMKQSFEEQKNEEIKDLEEILEKIKLQKDTLDKSQQYRKLMPMIEDNYKNLKDILSTNEEDKAISPIRHTDEKIVPNQRRPLSGTLLSNLFRTLNHSNCPPQKTLQNQALDIIRLILIYIATKPTHKYICRLAQIANNELDIFLRI